MYIVCHYGEIGLKGGNRSFFENKLMQNIKERLALDDFLKIQRISGRIIIQLSEQGIKNRDKIKNDIKNIFGISHFSFAENCQPNLVDIKNKALEILEKIEFETFKIETQRSEKNFPMKSPEISREVGAYIVEKLKKRVKMKGADIVCFIEIVNNYVFIFYKKEEGLGGLPIGVGGKVLVLLSGGIDSPVAAWSLMKRGIEVEFIHFHSYPYTSKEAIKKVEEIVDVLKKYQRKIRLEKYSFTKIQEKIFLEAPEKFRVILYKRFMIKIATKIAKEKGIFALGTGDNLGQVASQTLENINVIDQATDLSILRPLLTFDKNEIIQKAKMIETYQLSIIPYQDCCTRFIPAHPSTKTKIADLEAIDKILKIDIL